MAKPRAGTKVPRRSRTPKRAPTKPASTTDAQEAHQQADRVAEGRRLLANQLRVARRFCQTFKIPARVLRAGNDGVLPRHQWEAAATRWLVAAGRGPMLSARSEVAERDCGAVRTLRGKLFAGTLSDDRDALRIIKAARVAEYDVDGAADLTLRQCVDRGWMPEQVASVSLADLAALVEGPGPAGSDSGKDDSKGDSKSDTSRPFGPAEEKCAKLFRDQYQAYLNGVGRKPTRKQVIIEYVRKNPGAASTLARNLAAHPEQWKPGVYPYTTPRRTGQKKRL